MNSNNNIIEQKQKDLFLKFSKKIKLLKKKDIDISLSFQTFGCTWHDNLSFMHLKYLSSPSLYRWLRLIYYVALDTFFISTLDNFIYRENKDNKKYKNLVCNWASKKCFTNKGKYTDEKFVNFLKKDTAWLCLGYDDMSNIKFEKKCFLFFNRKPKFKIPFLLKKLFSIFIHYNFSFSKIYNFANFYSQYSLNLIKIVENLIKRKNIKKIIFPYEGQPFQDYIIKYLKKKNLKLKIFGYAHSSQPLPLHLINKDNKIDKLIAHNHNQYFHLNKRLGWPKSQLKLEKSKKIVKLDKNKYLNTIMLPYGFNSSKLILKNIKYLAETKKINFKNFYVKNHPLMKTSNMHIKLVKDINNVIKNYTDEKKFKIQKSITIIIGATSSAPEALQTIKNVYHIFEDGITQAYSNFFWPNILVEYINNYTTKYTTNNKKKLFIK